VEQVDKRSVVVVMDKQWYERKLEELNDDGYEEIEEKEDEEKLKYSKRSQEERIQETYNRTRQITEDESFPADS